MDVEILLSVGRIVERLTILGVAAFMTKSGAKLLASSSEGNSTIDFKSTLGRLKITKASTGILVIFFSMFVLTFALFSSLKLNDLSTGKTEHVGAGQAVASSDSAALNAAGAHAKSQVNQVTTKTETKTERKVQYSDAATAGYMGPKISLQELQSFYKLTFQAYHEKSVSEGIRTGLFNLYQQLYEKNKMTDKDRDILQRLSVKFNLTPEELQQKRQLENNKLSEEFASNRIQQ